MQSIALMARIKKPSKTKFTEKISKCNMQILVIRWTGVKLFDIKFEY